MSAQVPMVEVQYDTTTATITAAVTETMTTTVTVTATPTLGYEEAKRMEDGEMRRRKSDQQDLEARLMKLAEQIMF
jgi:hypothetical protein